MICSDRNPMGEFARDPILARAFLAAAAREAHQILKPGKLRGPVGIDGTLEARKQILVGHAHLHLGCAGE